MDLFPSVLLCLTLNVYEVLGVLVNLEGFSFSLHLFRLTSEDLLTSSVKCTFWYIFQFKNINIFLYVLQTEIKLDGDEFVYLFSVQMANVTPEYIAEVIDKFELSDENKQRGVMGIEGKFLPFHQFFFRSSINFLSLYLSWHTIRLKLHQFVRFLKIFLVLKFNIR